MLFADKADIARCTELVRKEFTRRSLLVTDDVLSKTVIDVMNISDSKGGDYSDAVIHSFAETYIERGFYKKFIGEN